MSERRSEPEIITAIHMRMTSHEEPDRRQRALDGDED